MAKELSRWAVQGYLENWADWQRRGKPGKLPNHSSGLYGAGNSDFDSMCEEMDITHAQATEAAVLGLQDDERHVLHNHYLGARWPVLGALEALERAYARLTVLLYEKGLPER